MPTIEPKCKECNDTGKHTLHPDDGSPDVVEMCIYCGGRSVVAPVDTMVKKPK